MNSFRKISSRRLLYGGFLAAFLVLAGNLCLAIFVPDSQFKTTLSDISAIIGDSLAAAALIYAAWRLLPVSRRQARAWRLVAWGQFFFMAGDITWFILEIILHQQPYPSLADLFYMAVYPLFFAGVILMPAQQYTKTGQLKKGLDMTIVMLAAGLGFWNFLIGPLAEAGKGGPVLEQALSLAYPVGDLLLLAGLLVIVFEGKEISNRWPVSLLAAGMISMVITDCLFSYQSMIDTYTSGGLLDAGWQISNIFVGLAGIWQAAKIETGAQAETDPSEEPGAKPGHLQVTYLPYIALAAAFFLLAWSHNQALPMKFSSLIWWVGLLIALILMRQIVMMIENSNLYLQLLSTTDQVRQQANKLNQANWELKKEIAERMRIEDRLSYDALHDALTHLPNRALLMDRLSHAIEYKKRHTDFCFSLLFLDLDEFKIINDSLGHNTGDQFLVQCAERLSANIRTTDIVARLGGDEFVILIEDNQNEGDAVCSAQRILDEFRKPFILAGHQVFVTASIGIANGQDEYERPEEILRDADIAMYRAKSAGKARYEIFQPALREQAMARLDLESDLRQALDHNEFSLHYQPIRSLETGQMVGLEALLRWRHPQRGWLLPGEFIPMAEETRMIVPIGWWVLREGCRQLRIWNNQNGHNQPLKINVNISAMQVNHPGFAEQVEQILNETNLPGCQLRLEITENVCLTGAEAVKTAFDKLGKLGVELLIDDFGIGYSSLSYLHQFHIQGIKIDRAFVSRIASSPDSAEIVRSLIRLVGELGLEATAEGIETEEQLALLKQMGCPYGQGFLFSPPVSQEEITL